MLDLENGWPWRGREGRLTGKGCDCLSVAFPEPEVGIAARRDREDILSGAERGVLVMCMGWGLEGGGDTYQTQAPSRARREVDREIFIVNRMSVFNRTRSYWAPTELVERVVTHENCLAKR